MDTLVRIGIDWIVAIQSLGGWLELPMRFFTNLGSEEVFALVLPAIYWSIDAGLGLRVSFILVFTTSLNDIFKMVFAGPRPYWVSTRVKPLWAEGSFGVPSGHAQRAASIWGIIAGRAGKSWAWFAAIVVIFLIGFSRLYLGAHFVHDVLMGWLFGAFVLWLFLRYWDSVAAWIKNKSLARQTLIVFAFSMIFVLIGLLGVTMRAGFVLPQEWIDNALRAGSKPDPISMSVDITIAGNFFGFAFGAAWIASRGGYQATGPVGKRALRYIIGLVGVLLFWKGLDVVFPSSADLIGFFFRYLRYALVGFWISAGAPFLFFHFKLAEKPKM